MFQIYFIVYLININIIAFILCLIDKIKSIKGWYRISEKCLILISTAGGCFGMAIAMNLFKHKTNKTKFKIIYLLCVIYLILIKNLI